MITALNLARIAKLVALLGFVFPWVLVSCSGEPIAHLTGIDLATGGLTMQSPGKTAIEAGHPNLWVMLSLAAVIGGIAASFLLQGRQALLAMATLAIVALVASAIGVSTVVTIDQAATPRQRGASSPPLNRVDLQYGYLMTVAGLLVAIGACGTALGRRGGP
jgi:hypothetical protein